MNDNQIQKFNLFYKLLIETNNKFNLTRITEFSDVWDKHFLDCIEIAKYTPKNARIIDVGTGAGFPAIPLAIMRDDVRITAIDATLKRVNFVNDVAKELDLNNLTCIHARAEELGHNSDFREKYDIATSRAVADLRILAEYCLPFVKIGGVMLAMKGLNIDEELENAKEIIAKLGGKEAKKEIYSIAEFTHSIIIIKKELETPLDFPRKIKKLTKRI